MTQILTRAEFADLSAAHQQLVRDKVGAATREQFESRKRDKDKDGDYRSIVDEAKQKTAAILAATLEVDRSMKLGGEYHPQVKAAQTAVNTAITGYGDDIGAKTTALTDALKDITSSLGSRMTQAKTLEGSSARFAGVADQTPQFKKKLKELDDAIAAGKQTDKGIGNPQLAAISKASKELETMGEIDGWSVELRDKYKAPPHVLKAALATDVFKLRHAKPSGYTKAELEKQYEDKLAAWRLTPEGNNASAVAPDETKDVSAVSTHLSDHIFKGHFNAAGEATGVHHKAALGADVRLVPGTRVERGQGFYESKIERRRLGPPGADGVRAEQWVAKGPASTFFPDAWSQTQVKEQITKAWKSPTKVAAGEKWKSVIGGLTYMFYGSGAQPSAAWVQF